MRTIMRRRGPLSPWMSLALGIGCDKKRDSIYVGIMQMKSSITRRQTLLAGVGLAGYSVFDPRAANAKVEGLVVVGKDDWLFPLWDELLHLDRKMVDAVGAVVTSAIDALNKAKIQVVIMYTPAKSRVLREMLPDDFKFNADTDKRYDLGRAAFGKGGTLVPDLFTVLSALHTAQPNTPLFFKGDTHWNGTGAEAAAVAMAKSIKEKIKLPAAPGPGATLGPIEQVKQEKNDLAALLPTSAEKSKYKLESFPVHAQATAGGLLDSVSADVAVVGNSFTQPRFGFANMLSNQLERPVDLFWRVHQVGPYSTLLQYIDSQGFKDRKPSLIVWDFHETDITLPPERKDGWGTNAMASADFLTKLRTALKV